MFNIDSNVGSKSNAVAQLAGNKIHTVKFKGAEVDDLVSKKDGQTFKVLKFKFENEEGSFEDTIFEPKADDAKRKDNDFGYQNPSAVEEMMAKFRHIIAAVNPELDKQIEAKTKTIGAKDWDSMRKVMIAATNKGIDKEVQIKLIEIVKKDKNDASKTIKEAKFPGFFLGISKTNNVYMKTNFVGSGLTFTKNEEERMAKVAGAKPTAMSSGSSTPAAGGADDVDFDLEDL